MWNGKSKAVTFSFDDGVLQDVRLTQLLNKYNLKCTFNLNSELLGKPNFLTRCGQRISHYKIHPKDVKEVYEGHEVAVHTLTHPNLTALDDEKVLHQVEQDRRNLSELTGYDVVGMAYPCGGVNNDERVVGIIKNHTGVKYSRTITNTDSFDIQKDLYRFDPNVHILQWDRLWEMGRNFVDLTPDKPQLFYIWGHAYEMDYDSSNWSKTEEFFKFISNRDDIFYGTNAEILL